MLGGHGPCAGSELRACKAGIVYRQGGKKKFFGFGSDQTEERIVCWTMIVVMERIQGPDDV